MGYTYGRICAVNGCYNYKYQSGERKSFFRMPKDPNLLKSWIAACNHKNLDLLAKSKEPEYFYNLYVVCSDHFQLQCFRNKNLFSQGLIPGSIPTLKLLEVKTPIEVQNHDKTEEVKIEKIWLNETPKVVIAAAKPIIVLSPLEEENNRLKQMIKEYRKKLKSKNSLIWNYKKRNHELKIKLRQQKNFGNPTICESNLIRAKKDNNRKEQLSYDSPEICTC